MTIFIVVLCITLLVLLITWGKINSFLAFLIVSLVAGWLLGIPPDKIVHSIQQGIGDILGSLVTVICLGAMLGKLVAESGAAQVIARSLQKIFGEKYIQWAVMITGFIVGLPLFFDVSFVLMIPLVFSVVYQYKLPAVYIGIPMMAAISVTHGFLPPHPAPVALVSEFHGNMGITLLYGILIAIPTIVLAGPVFAASLKNIRAVPLQTFLPKYIPEDQMPGRFNSFIVSLLPVILLMLFTLLSFLDIPNSQVKAMLSFFGNPVVVMIISLLVATYTLGIRRGKTIKNITEDYGDSVKDIAMILLVIAGAGALKQVFVDSGVSNQVASGLNGLSINPLVLGWLVAAIIRVCIGSATIAGLTTASMIIPIMQQSHVNPNLMVLSVGAGSLMFSHVNDAGFWLFKEYFNITIKETFLSWSLMETIVSVMGLIGVLILQSFV
ncbi:MAG: gluconate:H+ symporter [Bacteroidota bacterium]|nr:gluconate:H+ symporter [Bacteroidota bacterium]